MFGVGAFRRAPPERIWGSNGRCCCFATLPSRTTSGSTSCSQVYQCAVFASFIRVCDSNGAELHPSLEDWLQRSPIFALSSAYLRCCDWTSVAVAVINPELSMTASAIWAMFCGESTTFLTLRSINESRVDNGPLLATLFWVVIILSTSLFNTSSL